MSNTPPHSAAASMSQPQTPAPSPVISPSAMLPIYPAIDIDAQVSSGFRSRGHSWELIPSWKTLTLSFVKDIYKRNYMFKKYVIDCYG